MSSQNTEPSFVEIWFANWVGWDEGHLPILTGIFDGISISRAAHDGVLTFGCLAWKADWHGPVSAEIQWNVNALHQQGGKWQSTALVHSPPQPVTWHLPVVTDPRVYFIQGFVVGIPQLIEAEYLNVQCGIRPRTDSQWHWSQRSVPIRRT